MSGPSERKLQGIYDCIDVRNFKGAIKLCQKKDVQNYDITKTLLAYSLISMQRTEEGLELAREVKSRGPTDESVLKTLGHSFRLTQMDTELAECYETALAQKPGSEDEQERSPLFTSVCIFTERFSFGDIGMLDDRFISI